MSDQMNVELLNLTSENNKLKAVLTHLNAKNMVQSEAINEFLNANILLRTNSVILEETRKTLEEKNSKLEEQVKNMNANIIELNEKVRNLENCAVLD